MLKHWAKKLQGALKCFWEIMTVSQKKGRHEEDNKTSVGEVYKSFWRFFFSRILTFSSKQKAKKKTSENQAANTFFRFSSHEFSPPTFTVSAKAHTGEWKKEQKEHETHLASIFSCTQLAEHANYTDFAIKFHVSRTLRGGQKVSSTNITDNAAMLNLKISFSAKLNLIINNLINKRAQLFVSFFLFSLFTAAVFPRWARSEFSTRPLCLN